MRSAEILCGEHSGQPDQSIGLGLLVDAAQLADKPGLVDRSDLVQDDVALFSLKATGNTGKTDCLAYLGYFGA
jgi:hypothetical protein